MNDKKAILMQYEKEAYFIHFFHAFLTYLLYICRSSEKTCDDQPVDDERFMLQLLCSLTHMGQLHVAMFSLKTYFRTVHYIPISSRLTFNEAHSKLIVPKLREIASVIAHHPMIEKGEKRHLLALIEQIKNYYLDCDFSNEEEISYPHPWLALSVREREFKGERCSVKNDQSMYDCEE